MTEKLIPRLYRITKEQDTWVKKESKKKKISESEVIRQLLQINEMASPNKFIS